MTFFQKRIQQCCLTLITGQDGCPNCYYTLRVDLNPVDLLANKVFHHFWVMKPTLCLLLKPKVLLLDPT